MKGGHKMDIYPVLEIDLDKNKMVHIQLIEIYTSLDDVKNHDGIHLDKCDEMDFKEFEILSKKWKLNIVSPCKIYSVVCNGRQFYWVVITGKDWIDQSAWKIPCKS
jgi:hypothetical protein